MEFQGEKNTSHPPAVSGEKIAARPISPGSSNRSQAVVASATSAFSSGGNVRGMDHEKKPAGSVTKCGRKCRKRRKKQRTNDRLQGSGKYKNYVPLE